MFNPATVLNDCEILDLAERVHHKAIEAATVSDHRVLALQAFGSAERAGVTDVRADVIERLSDLLVTLDDLLTDALAISEWLSEGAV